MAKKYWMTWVKASESRLRSDWSSRCSEDFAKAHHIWVSQYGRVSTWPGHNLPERNANLIRPFIMVVSELNRLSYALSEDDSEEVIAAKLCDIVSSNIEKPDGTPLSQSELVDFVTVWLDAPPTKTRIDCWPKFLEILYGEPFVLESRFKKGAFGVSGSNKWAEGVFPASFDPKERDFIMSLWALDGQEVRFYKKPTETFEEAKLEGAYDPIGAFDTLWFPESDLTPFKDQRELAEYVKGFAATRYKVDPADIEMAPKRG